MEQLQKYQVDFGEVNIRGEQEDTVRIMSIHKSKGLEFPIVFAAGMGKRFNMSDASNGLVIHQDLGIGMQAVDPKERTQASSLVRQVIQKQIRAGKVWVRNCVCCMWHSQEQKKVDPYRNGEKDRGLPGSAGERGTGRKRNFLTGCGKAHAATGTGFFRHLPEQRTSFRCRSLRWNI